MTKNQKDDFMNITNKMFCILADIKGGKIAKVDDAKLRALYGANFSELVDQLFRLELFIAAQPETK